MLLISRILIIASISLIFVAYSNFAPMALGSEGVADYTKNHFVREIIFGLALATYTIYLAATATGISRCLGVAVMGSVVVFPFWIAAAMGWSTGGMELVWSTEIDSGTAYLLHGTQVVAFYLGLMLMIFAIRKPHD